MFYICSRGLVEKVCYAQDEEDILMQKQDTVPLFFPGVIEDLIFWVRFDNFHIYHQELFSNTTFVYVYNTCIIWIKVFHLNLQYHSEQETVLQEFLGDCKH